MLLIHDHQAKPVEVDLLLNERVGADDEVCLAMCDASARHPFVMQVKRSGEKGDPVVARCPLQQLACSQVVLRREDLGGRHQRCLVAILDGDQHSLQSDDSFAGADIAL